MYLIQNAPPLKSKKSLSIIKMLWHCRQNDPLRYEKRGKEHEQTLLLKQMHELFKGEEKNSPLLIIFYIFKQNRGGNIGKKNYLTTYQGGEPQKD